jgi:hypothetical protein
MRILDYTLHRQGLALPEIPPPERVALRDGQLVFQDLRLSRLDAQGDVLWQLHLPARPRRLHRQGNRAMLLTRTDEYHSWGYLGPALLLDLESGNILAELRGERGLALPDQRFLLGLEGYDCFDTWLYDAQGTQLQQWRSYGHYFADPDGSIRVCECDRSSPTNSNIVRLHLDGRIERGPALRDGQIPRPVELPDGDLILLDEGYLRRVDRSLQHDYSLHLQPFIAWSAVSQSALWIEDGHLQVASIARGVDPEQHQVHHWTIQL